MTDEDEAPRPRHDAGGRRPTINDVARIAGVSKKTVSRVINRSPFVKTETRDKISRIILDIGFVPDPQARGLAFRRSFAIGLISDDPNPHSVVATQLGLLDVIRGAGYELVVHPCNRNDPDFIAGMRRFIERQKLFGVVLTPPLSEDSRLRAALKEAGCAGVCVTSGPADTDGVIARNDCAGGRLAAQHLADLGHSRIALVSGPECLSMQERRRGFQQVLDGHGLPLRSEYVMEDADTVEGGASCGATLLARSPRPTAIFAASGAMAAGVVQAARRAGLAIPQDLSVIGFDDCEIASAIWPRLTAIRSPTREIARRAAQRLIGADGPADDILPTFVAGESTGRAPKG
ncbi:LacI family DNA-binding transcriptional regulator [Terricaulis sp.]|uniref:LacI family DNA-binding transcriptional regulator n=1 Tax=Terricaulis sp. TaxID=2768686 RepID=UPI003783E921